MTSLALRLRGLLHTFAWRFLALIAVSWWPTCVLADNSVAPKPFEILDTASDSPEGVFVQVRDTGGRKFVYPEGYTIYGWFTGHPPRTSANPVQFHFDMTTPMIPIGCDIAPSGAYVLMRMSPGMDNNYQSPYDFFIWNLNEGRLMIGSGLTIYNKNIHWSPNSDAFTYVEGNHPGSSPLEVAPMSLNVFYAVPQIPRARGLSINPYAYDSAWTVNNDVIYTGIPNEYLFDAHGQYYDPHCNIYVRPSGITPSDEDLINTPGKLLITRGCNPTPSPDGKWIAYFGWPERTGRKDEPPIGSPEDNRQLGLYVYDLRSQKRTLIHPVDQLQGVDETMAWSADSKTLFDIRAHYSPSNVFVNSDRPQDHPENRTADVFAISVPAMTSRHIAAIDAHNAAQWPDLRDQFVAKGVSRDGRWLLVIVNEIGSEIHMKRDMYQSLVGVRLSDGQTRILWKTKNVDAVDWHEITGPSDPWLVAANSGKSLPNPKSSSGHHALMRSKASQVMRSQISK